MAWAQQVIEGLIQIETKEFDEELWYYRKILEAFENEALMQGFIKYKLTHKPTTHSITTAIALKFKYIDRNFFRTFTRNKKIMPAHQKEFEEIYEQAVQNYKGKHSITVTNREIIDQINKKVRQKIAINLLPNYKMVKNPREIAKVLDYCRGLMKMESELQGDKMWRVINEAIQNTLQQLPENPEEIPKEITNILPFNLPLRNRTNLRAILAALRKIYTFAQLPDSYFVKLEQLPSNPKDLNTDLRGIFPIKDRRDLRDLIKHKRALAEYYK
ncbi:hypothetical protein C2G38_2274138 [Gigaspora rosea]|uniref:Uncharacterized protein n=1 Tax=Gigaspora rosea TaxID=44941 RepID=A0A397UB43_9GLOM|nr:hypothetical protein C2G38_2274138 [Gigaspora rosea]